MAAELAPAVGNVAALAALRRRGRARPAALAAVAILMGGGAPTAMAETYQWVQYAADGLEVRALTTEASCPAAAIDDAPAAMGVRAAPSPEFPVLTCALQLPAARPAALPGRPVVTVAGVPMALPGSRPNRIAVIGDTGCRLKNFAVQACNDPTQWPFRLIAEVIAQLKPDLVIHVGDYQYRETPCPPGNLGCGGSPYGDGWSAWRADFFAPADTLLRVAPWVFTRGNHEICRRAGRGWSRALDPYPFDSGRGCNGTGRPFAARLGGLALAVMDVSSAREDAIDDAQASFFRAQYRALADLLHEPAWIVQHRPIWAPFRIIDGKPVGGNKMLAVAAADTIPREVALILSGHHHLFQALSYERNLPAQIVSGHGGDSLDLGLPRDTAGWVVNGATVKAGLNTPGIFGFTLFERHGDGWQISDRDRMGVEQRSCGVTGREVSCAAD
jgi:hypothetical protein